MLSSSRAAVPARGQATGLPCPGASSPLLASPLLSSLLLYCTVLRSLRAPCQQPLLANSRDKTRRDEAKRGKTRPSVPYPVLCQFSTRPSPKEKRRFCVISSIVGQSHVVRPTRAWVFQNRPFQFPSTPLFRRAVMPLPPRRWTYLGKNGKNLVLPLRLCSAIRKLQDIRLEHTAFPSHWAIG